MKEYLLGIDIGSSAVKLALARTDGETVASASGNYPTYYPQRGWAEQNPNDWWQAICQQIRSLIKNAGIAARDIGAIGVDGYSWAAVALGKKGQVLCNTPLWYDIRAAEECTFIREQLGEEQVFDLCGNPVHPNYTLPKVLWYKNHLAKVVPGIHTILQTNGFIVYRLTGELTQDVSQAYGYHCFDIRRGTWNLGMLEKLGIDPQWLPEISSCSQVVGTVTAAAARETGLHPGTLVVAGGLDAACGTLGAGVLHRGQTQEQGGQAGGVSICTDDCIPVKNMILSNHVVPGRWLVQGGTVGGGGIMRWLAGILKAQESADSAEYFAQMDQWAGQVPAGAEGLLFLPYMAGERSPIWDENAKGVFFGLDYAKNRGHIIRAAMEGAAFALKHNLEAAGSAADNVQEMRSVGGASKSSIWMQIKADITGIPIRPAGGDLATARGALILAGVGTGMLPGFEKACEQFVQLGPVYVPDGAQKARYDVNYDRYLRLYTQLKELMKGC